MAVNDKGDKDVVELKARESWQQPQKSTFQQAWICKIRMVRGLDPFSLPTDISQK